MTIDDLILSVRQDYLDDEGLPHLWSDTQLNRYALEGIKEACLRSQLLTRTYSKLILADTATYALDSSVRQILFLKLASVSDPLVQASDSDLSYYNPAWRLKTGTPSHYVRSGNKITLYPIPILSDTLTISSTNIPDDNFDLEADIDPAYHSQLAYWMAYKAFLKPDDETYNPKMSAEFLARFEQAFGVAHSAKYDQVSFNMPTYATITSGRMC